MGGVGGDGGSVSLRSDDCLLGGGARAIRCWRELTSGASATQPGGNMEGKEVRFGIANSALFATVTTDASCGAVNGLHDSFTPLGGMVPLVNIMLSEVVFGGVGAGLYGILIYVVLAVFIAGLMVGRTPEYLGKKIEAYDVKMAMLVTLVFPLVILAFTAISSVAGFGTSSISNPGAPWLDADSLRLYVASGQQRFGLRRAERKHALVQHHGRHHHAGGTFLHDHAHAGDRRKPGEEEICSAVAGNVSRDHAVVQRAAGGRDFDCRRTDLFPGAESGTHPRAPVDGSGQDFLRNIMAEKHSKTKSIWDLKIVRRATSIRR